MMDKLTRFIDCFIPTETCNLRCHYCYITQLRKFENKLVKFNYSPDIIRKALSAERLGGQCLLNFCAGGETLLSNEVIPVVRSLLEEGHYVMIVTNGTLSHRFDELSALPHELAKHLFIKFSFHYIELKNRGWIERYFQNVDKIRTAGISFTIELTPSDELIPMISEVREVCQKYVGADCHVTIARDDRTNGINHLSNLNWEEYKRVWSIFDSEMFEFKTSIFYKRRTEFCYAGDWSAYLNLQTGDMYQCYHGKRICNIYQSIDKKIPFFAVGSNCTQAHCYNGHAFLTLGDIPELDTVCYAETRNRVCTDGSEWLQPEMKAFMSQKLKEKHVEYPQWKKVLVNFGNKCYLLGRRIKNVIKT